jgi:hypothetical protein
VGHLAEVFNVEQTGVTWMFMLVIMAAGAEVCFNWDAPQGSTEER